MKVLISILVLAIASENVLCARVPTSAKCNVEWVNNWTFLLGAYTSLNQNIRAQNHGLESVWRTIGLITNDRSSKIQTVRTVRTLHLIQSSVGIVRRKEEVLTMDFHCRSIKRLVFSSKHALCRERKSRYQGRVLQRRQRVHRIHIFLRNRRVCTYSSLP